MLSPFLQGLAGLTNKSSLADLDKFLVGDSQSNMWNSKNIGFAQLRSLIGGDVNSVNGLTGTIVLGLGDLDGVPDPVDPNTVLIWNGSSFEWGAAPSGGAGGVIGVATWRQDSTGDGTITGAINGSNTSFELTNTPISSTSVIVMHNGLVMENGVTDDYTISGKIVTFTTAPVSGKVSAQYVTQTGAFNGATLTASELLATDPDKNLVSLPVASYPSLAEIAFMKGVTSGVQGQIDALAPIASPTFTGTVGGITKTMVGLTNVDNTSDATKNSATVTLANKRITKRVITTTQSATPTINTDNTDISSITALAQAITSMTTNLTGTPVDGDSLIIRITDNGTARAITWGAKFEASTTALPTTTVISTLLMVGFVWNTVTSKWRCVAVS